MIDAMLEWDNLCEAWERVADNRGAPGLDKISVRRFAGHWETNLRRLRQLVLEQRYRPGELRRVAIPKKEGGQRLLQIPNVGDRVLQRAALNVLEPVYEQVFLDCSYGYRPGRGLRQAVATILGYRDGRKLLWVLDSDVDNCFDSIDHSTLVRLLMEDVSDYRVLGILRRWLENGRRYRRPDRGIALGMPISPLLCNVYLHQLDRALRGNRWAYVRYADDFLVLCATRRQAEHARQVVSEILLGLKLQLEPTKTQITTFSRGFDYLGVHFERDSYAFPWEGKQVQVSGTIVPWLWSYMPEGYE
ncbi:MAG: group II intron reverse transcriptase/maturase [Chloroflexi bacterium]|nr:group II intron reverse transcriptase/maturase [Chloroflexota bacterium]